MNKTLAATVIAFSLTAPMFSIVGCSNTVHQESTGQFVDSSAITVKVKSELLADKYVKSLPITVKTYKNNVQLSGFVDNEFQKNRALQIARQVAGVKSVTDSLVIKNN